MQSQEIELYLQELNEELEDRAIAKPVRIVVVGGVYMLAFIKNRSSTKDVDIIPLSFPDSMNEDKHTKAFRSATNAVAKKHQLRRNWMNDVVASFAPEPELAQLHVWQKYANLHVYVPSAEYILALKLLAGRDRDEDDIQALCAQLSVHTHEQAQELVDRFATPDWQRECCLDVTLDALF
jgi:hypothetical protein